MIVMFFLANANCASVKCASEQKCLRDPAGRVRVRCVNCKLKKFCGDGIARASRPVCGTDGKTYPNWCALRRASCQMNRYIEVRHNKSCEARQ